ncbi:aa3-type cytochrome oxidase subunit III [Ornithinimicrobium cryptoxanthini]|uniref:cytochrome-c oxidase n=1 Tax=Ornithinimicrobium cryptoxanthini TaxID=2934161 RepID=A0ABY4YMH8_9MICO|nr:heme-copper oxidase subunit III [Ornithinimicrobium cryptoxanthini]USQ77995.1 heme-copper oxidase subunit III [Ornithinimicrobium cryptoxanthini]
MTTAATAGAAGRPLEATQGPATRPDMTMVGTMVWLGSEIMFFAGLFAMYFTIRAVSTELWDERTAMLNVPFAAVNTTILVISSVWCQIGVFKAEEGRVSRTGSLFDLRGWGMREWFVLTYIFGAIFVSGQIWEYATLISEGVMINSDPYGSVFYMTTGFHGIHVSLGLFAFLLIVGRSFTAKRFTHAQKVGAHVVSYYWHFVDVVWVALFFTIYVLQ